MSTPPPADDRVPILSTERLILRELVAEDADFIVALTNDPEWLRYIGDRGIRTADDARAYIENVRTSYARHGYGLWAVELREDGTTIGSCGLVKRDWLEHSDLGYAFLADYRGKGYARESAAATLEHARDTLGMTHLLAIVTPENRDSIQLLTKLGMTLERMAPTPGAERELCVYGRALG